MAQNLNLIANMQNSSMAYKCPDCGRSVVDAEITLPAIGKKVIVPRYGCQCFQNKEIKRCIGQDGIARNKDIFEMSGIGKRFKQCTFENFQIYFEVSKAFEAVAEYAESFNKYSQEGKGLYISGGCGVGKSHLVCALAQELIFQNHTCLFILVPELLELIRKSYNTKLSDEEMHLLSKIGSVELLILDDAGSERGTLWVQEQLFMLLNKRYGNMQPTVITTNCNGAELEEKLGKRIVSRLIQSSIMVNISAPDYRLRKSEVKQV
jgi:DNA replication protein DnaC